MFVFTLFVPTKLFIYLFIYIIFAGRYFHYVPRYVNIGILSRKKISKNLIKKNTLCSAHNSISTVKLDSREINILILNQTGPRVVSHG